MSANVSNARRAHLADLMEQVGRLEQRYYLWSYSGLDLPCELSGELIRRPIATKEALTTIDGRNGMTEPDYTMLLEEAIDGLEHMIRRCEPYLGSVGSVDFEAH